MAVSSQLSRTVEAADDEAELLDVVRRLATRFLSWSHLLPNREVVIEGETAADDDLGDESALKECCRQPDSDLQLALPDGVELDPVALVEVLEDTAVFSVP